MKKRKIYIFSGIYELGSEKKYDFRNKELKKLVYTDVINIIRKNGVGKMDE